MPKSKIRAKTTSIAVPSVSHRSYCDLLSETDWAYIRPLRKIPYKILFMHCISCGFTAILPWWIWREYVEMLRYGVLWIKSMWKQAGLNDIQNTITHICIMMGGWVSTWTRSHQLQRFRITECRHFAQAIHDITLICARVDIVFIILAKIKFNHLCEKFGETTSLPSIQSAIGNTWIIVFGHNINLSSFYIHTHTYIYIYREREREK